MPRQRRLHEAMSSSELFTSGDEMPASGAPANNVVDEKPAQKKTAAKRARGSGKPDPIRELVDDTIEQGKQALVFVNAKRSAESVAEDLAKRCDVQYPELGKKVLKALSSPTVQCKRLAYCVERGMAFHHAGLVAAQRRVVEEEFLAGKLKVICATPTLAAGVNVPAFRVIIRDLHRFEGYMTEIPVLEYRQMSGRAGRPDFHDDYGEAITIAKSPGDAEWIEERYWNGEPEPIFSKLASLPALRMAVLGLYATRFMRTRVDLFNFFAKTFFAHQYGSAEKIEEKLIDVCLQLQEWGFLVGDNATPLGRRVSQLYIDPLSASILLQGIQSKKPQTDAAIAHLVCSCMELRPLLRLKVNDFANGDVSVETLIEEPSMFSAEYEEFLQAAKTASMLTRWMDEAPEEIILEEYAVRPGELRAKLETADWLLYSATELCRLTGAERRPFFRARTRMKYGVKAELVPLLRLRGVGRVRARALYRAGLTSLTEVQAAPDRKLTEILGPVLAAKVKEQLRGQRSAGAEQSKL
jgi:helicase